METDYIPSLVVTCDMMQVAGCASAVSELPLAWESVSVGDQGFANKPAHLLMCVWLVYEVNTREAPGTHCNLLMPKHKL